MIFFFLNLEVSGYPDCIIINSKQGCKWFVIASILSVILLKNLKTQQAALGWVLLISTVI